MKSWARRLESRRTTPTCRKTGVRRRQNLASAPKSAERSKLYALSVLDTGGHLRAHKFKCGGVRAEHRVPFRFLEPARDHDL
jgi:hypothetical protein